MKFIPLESAGQLSEIKEAKGYHIIFKHNTTCSISKGVYRRLGETTDDIAGMDSIYILDLMANRDLSDAIATDFNVPHQSPQVLLISDGQCTYNEWGYDISAEEIAAAVKK